MQPGIGRGLANIDETAPVLDPKTRFETLGDHVAQRPGPQFLTHAFGKRHQALADQHGQQGEQAGNPEQRHQQVARRQSGSAENGNLRVPRQRRQRIQTADQHRYGDQLIDHPGQAQGHENHRMAQLIPTLADAAQFVDQVEKAEEREECRKHEKNSGEGFAHEIALV